MTGRDFFKSIKPILNFFAVCFKILPNFIRVFIWNSINNHQQLLFNALKYIILKSMIKKCGDNIRIGANVRIISWKHLELGDNISIHDNCYIDATGGVNIGNDVSIAHSSSILSTNHDWKDITIPIKYNQVTFGKVIINDDVWVGCGCRILADVTIRNRAIIAAGAVVNKDVESQTIVGGIPAKVIKTI